MGARDWETDGAVIHGAVIQTHALHLHNKPKEQIYLRRINNGARCTQAPCIISTTDSEQKYAQTADSSAIQRNTRINRCFVV